MRLGRVLIAAGFCLGVAAWVVAPTELWSQGTTGSNQPEGSEPRAHTGENPVDLGTDPGTFTASTGTGDCATCFLGYTDDRFDFTLTTDMDVTVETNDCCLFGDRFEARFNDRNADEDMDGDMNNHEEDCIAGRQPAAIAPGTFDTVATATIPAGDWSLRVRDVTFQCDDDTTLCPAGYDVRISFAAPTGSPCAALMPCTDLATGDPSCQDEAGMGAPTLGALALALLALLLVAVGAWVLRRQRPQLA